MLRFDTDPAVDQTVKVILENSSDPSFWDAWGPSIVTGGVSLVVAVVALVGVLLGAKSNRNAQIAAEDIRHANALVAEGVRHDNGLAAENQRHKNALDQAVHFRFSEQRRDMYIQLEKVRYKLDVTTGAVSPGDLELGEWAVTRASARAKFSTCLDAFHDLTDSIGLFASRQVSILAYKATSQGYRALYTMQSLEALARASMPPGSDPDATTVRLNEELKVLDSTLAKLLEKMKSELLASDLPTS